MTQQPAEEQFCAVCCACWRLKPAPLVDTDKTLSLVIHVPFIRSVNNTKYEENLYELKRYYLSYLEKSQRNHMGLILCRPNK